MNTTWKFKIIILQLQTNCSVCDYIILYKIKCIIVHLTEVLVLLLNMLKFNALHTALLFTAGIVAETILTSVSSEVQSKKRSRHVFCYLAPMYAGQYLIGLKGASPN